MLTQNIISVFGEAGIQSFKELDVATGTMINQRKAFYEVSEPHLASILRCVEDKFGRE